MPQKLCRVRKSSSACQRWWPESFYKSGKFLQIRMIWKVSEWSEKCPDDLKSAQIIWKVPRWFAKCLDNLKDVQMIWETSRWCIECALLCVYTFCQTKIQIISLIGLNYYWKFPLFLTLKLPTTIFETIWYTLIWKIQTLRKGKVIFKCICIESLLETHNESLSQFLQSFITSLSLAEYEDSIQTQMRTFYSE